MQHNLDSGRFGGISAKVSRESIALGCASQILLMLYAFLNLIAGLRWEAKDIVGYGVLGIASSVLFLLFTILLAFPGKEIAETFGARRGSYTVIILGGLAAISGLTHSFSASGVLYSPSLYLMGLQEGVYYPFSTFTKAISLLFAGFVMASYGLFFTANRDWFENRYESGGLSKATGILYLGAALLYFSVLFNFAGIILIMIGSMVGLRCFLRVLDET